MFLTESASNCYCGDIFAFGLFDPNASLGSIDYIYLGKIFVSLCYIITYYVFLSLSKLLDLPNT